MLAYLSNTLTENNEEPRVLLVVDYSLHWYNVGLYTAGEFGVVDPIESTIGGSDVGNYDQLNAFEAAFEHIAIPQLDADPPAQIDGLIVYGDDTMNSTVLHLSQAMFGADLVQHALFSQSVYDGAAHVAKEAHIHMDTVDFEMTEKANFGCWWHSKLYSKEHIEL